MGERVRPAAWDRPLPRVLRAIVLDALRLGTGAALPTNAHYLGTVGATAGTNRPAGSPKPETRCSHRCGTPCTPA